jgi:hypothetical protein
VRNAFKILITNLKNERPLRRPRRRLKGNIKMDVTEIGQEVADWIHLAQNMDQ